MNINRRKLVLTLAMALLLTVTTLVSLLKADTGTCSGQSFTLPFSDVMGHSAFCYIAELYFLGITTGFGDGTYRPYDNVSRGQMATFLDRTHDSAVKRGSQRAALNQFWTTTPQYGVMAGGGMLGTTTVGDLPRAVASDGTDLWVANFFGNSVSRVRASDGKLLGTWTGANGPQAVLVAMGRVFVAGNGPLYMIDPSQPAGAVTTVANSVGGGDGIAFDGARIWTANGSPSGVSIITPGAPFTVTNVGGFNDPNGILYDGANIWVTDGGNDTLVKLNANGGVLQTVPVGDLPQGPIYDGTNIWVPNDNSHSVTVVRPANGMVLATLTGNGLNQPRAAAFDGQRILVVNRNGESVSLWKAADFTPLGFYWTGTGSVPYGACSDGLNFWIVLSGQDKLARF